MHPKPRRSRDPLAKSAFWASKVIALFEARGGVGFYVNLLMFISPRRRGEWCEGAGAFFCNLNFIFWIRDEPLGRVDFVGLFSIFELLVLF